MSLVIARAASIAARSGIEAGFEQEHEHRRYATEHEHEGEEERRSECSLRLASAGGKPGW